MNPDLLYVVPFGAVLVSIATLSMAIPHWWEKIANQAKVMTLCVIPVLFWAASQDLRMEAFLHEMWEGYGGFMAAVIPMMIAAGSLAISLSVRPTPLNNTCILAAGALVAMFVSPVCAAPMIAYVLIDVNRSRQWKKHTFLFLITIVGNVGGMVVPVGTPLIVALQQGIPFAWFLQNMLVPALIVKGTLLTMYFVWDSAAYAREEIQQLNAHDELGEPQTNPLVTTTGGWNIIVLALMAVTIASQPPLWLELFIMAALMSTAWWLVPRADQARANNKFSWHGSQEIAVLFAGIFATMTPALLLLKEHGGALGLQTALQFFLVCALLSGILDNAPTLACFLTLGATVRQVQTPVELTQADPVLLAVVCAGAVVGGALTYLGNAPNMAVRSIATERGIPMPNFVAFTVYQVPIVLIACFLPIILYFRLF